MCVEPPNQSSDRQDWSPLKAPLPGNFAEMATVQSLLRVELSFKKVSNYATVHLRSIILCIHQLVLTLTEYPGPVAFANWSCSSSSSAVSFSESPKTHFISLLTEY